MLATVLVGLFALASTASALSFGPGSVTLDAGDVGATFQVEFNGLIDGSPVTGLSGEALFEVVSYGTTLELSILLTNTSTAPVTSSRMSVLAFSVTPDVALADASVSGDFTGVGSGNLPIVGSREICLKGGGGPSCAGGGGAGATIGNPIDFDAELDFAVAPGSVILEGFAVRYQDIDIPELKLYGDSGVGVGQPIPEPSAAACFAVGALLWSARARRQRR